MPELSQRIGSISSSPTLKLLLTKNQMLAEGKPILDFGAGEPDFPTPANIQEAGIRAIRQNFTKYTPTAGLFELKNAIRQQYLVEQGFEPQDNRIVVSAGSKFGLFLLLQSVIDPGDEVIVPLPYWVSYPEIVRYGGGRVVFADHLRAERLFELTADSYIRVYGPKTKAVIINSPSNPTGQIMAEEELTQLIDFFSSRGVLVIVDDCYRRIIYSDRPYPSPLQLRPEAAENIAVVASFSKTFSMTGWRLGYVLASPPLCAAMTKLAEHSTSNPCSISQKAAVEALRGDQASVRAMVEEYRRRRDFLAQRIEAIGRIRYRMPEGAFYFFADFSQPIREKRLKDDNALALELLNQLNIIVVPGSAFGAPNHLRLSFATALDDLRMGLDRIEDYLKRK